MLWGIPPRQMAENHQDKREIHQGKKSSKEFHQGRWSKINKVKSSRESQGRSSKMHQGKYQLRRALLQQRSFIQKNPFKSL